MKHLEGIGQRMELVKRHFHYSNEELGKVCGVSYAAIAKIINGGTKDPGSSIIIKLSKKLKVNVKWLLFGEGEMMESEQESNAKEHPGTMNFLKSENENLKIIIEAKESENEILRKMVALLEESLYQGRAKKQAS